MQINNRNFIKFLDIIDTEGTEGCNCCKVLFGKCIAQDPFSCSDSVLFHINENIEDLLKRYCDE